MVVIALGSNCDSPAGGPFATVSSAMAALTCVFGQAVVASPFYSTPAFPPGNGADFVNACAVIETDDAPDVILSALHRIEADHGRVRGDRWAPRTLDLDLVCAGDRVLPDDANWSHWADLPLEAQMQNTPDRLILPHPRLQDRGFVLVPMADVAPDWIHPITGRTTVQMRDALPARARDEVVQVAPPV